MRLSGLRQEISGEVMRSFPTPAALAEATVDDLRKIKFSQRKAEYVTGIAREVASGILDLEGLHAQPDEEIVEQLSRIRGVGVWTAHWLLIRAFNRPDGFPHGDVALQRLVTSVVNGGTRRSTDTNVPRMTADEILEYSHRWSPYRSYVTTYLFAAVRTGFM